ncbi:MAG: hypothetical protein HYV07_04410 [Deltaproteobacteria bacterium]|nr:hypothetical protein [Deltaproteobacteria bacterium]
MATRQDEMVVSLGNVNKRLENLDKRLENVEGRLGGVASELHEFRVEVNQELESARLADQHLRNRLAGLEDWARSQGYSPSAR